MPVVDGTIYDPTAGQDPYEPDKPDAFTTVTYLADTADMSFMEGAAWMDLLEPGTAEATAREVAKLWRDPQVRQELRDLRVR